MVWNIGPFGLATISFDYYRVVDRALGSNYPGCPPNILLAPAETIVGQADIVVEAVAIIVGALACFSTVTLLSRAVASTGRTKVGWLVASACIFGNGVWTTLFVAMAAVGSVIPEEYAIGLVAGSSIIAILGIFPAFGLALRPNLTWPARACIGAIIAGTITGMQLIGMAAITSRAVIGYDGRLLIPAIGLGVGCSILAFRHIGQLCQTSVRVEMAALLLLGVVVVHYGVMASTLMVRSAGSIQGGNMLGSTLVLAMAAAIVIGLALAAALVDQQRRRLEKEILRLQQLADATTEGLLIHREGRVVWINAALYRMIGFTKRELIGSDAAAIATPGTRAILQRYLATPVTQIGMIEILRPDGGHRIAEIASGPVFYAGQAAGVVTLLDITERKQAEDRINHLANHDALTGLANRTLFSDRLTHEIARSTRSGDSLTVIIIDLARFKSVNDLHGHSIGDRLLQEVAVRLVRNIRETDTIACLGGDEFAVVQTGGAPILAAELAQRIIDVIEEGFRIDGHRISIGASAGIALYPQDGSDADVLLQSASLALSRAKREKRGTFCFFEASMDTRLRERRLLETDLRQAIAREELTVDYQPLVNCETLEAVGFEALVRWRHESRGFISPAEFIPLAEETSLILPLGRFVLASACREAASWPHPYHIAVNLSPVQFHMPNLAEEIVEIIAQSGLAPERLELEITEGVLIGDTDRTLRVLSRLKSQGIRIALDDFGTGYSSLSYLRRFPFDKIKIDRSFVQNLETDDGADAIVRAILAMAHSLHLEITAEGVETVAQLEILRTNGCDLVQGFLLGRPNVRPLSAVQWLQAHVPVVLDTNAGSSAEPL